MDSLPTLFDGSAPADRPVLPDPLRQLYGGDLRFPQGSGRPYVVGNFVSTIDGVVSYGKPGESGGGHVSGFNPQDAFVMGLLRAYADAVIVGARTLHGDPGHVRTAPFIDPAAQHEYAELRRTLGKTSPHPLNVVVSGSGAVDLGESTFHTAGLETVIVTSREGGARLEADHGPSLDVTRVRVVGDHRTLSGPQIVSLLCAEFGVRLLLHEGGPTLFGRFLADGLIDELFLTMAPGIAGRSQNESRPGLAGGVAFPPGGTPGFALVAVKRGDDHLFLRWRRQRRGRGPET